MSTSQTDRPSKFGDPKRDRMVQKVTDDAPGKANLFRRVYAGHASPRQAIKAHCLMCCGLSEREIRNCTMTACPCWSFRPYQLKTAAEKGGSHA